MNAWQAWRGNGAWVPDASAARPLRDEGGQGEFLGVLIPDAAKRRSGTDPPGVRAPVVVP